MASTPDRAVPLTAEHAKPGPSSGLLWRQCVCGAWYWGAAQSEADAAHSAARAVHPDALAALREAWEAHWQGIQRVEPEFETDQCRRETSDQHQRHRLFAEGFRAALAAADTAPAPLDVGLVHLLRVAMVRLEALVRRTTDAEAKVWAQLALGDIRAAADTAPAPLDIVVEPGFSVCPDCGPYAPCPKHDS